MINKAELIKGLDAALGVSGAASGAYDLAAVLFRFPEAGELQVIACDGATLLVIDYTAQHHVQDGTRFIVSTRHVVELLTALEGWEGDRLAVMPYKDTLIFSSGVDSYMAPRKTEGDYPDPATIIAIAAEHGPAQMKGARVIAALSTVTTLTGDEEPLIATRGTLPLIIKGATPDNSLARSLTVVSFYIQPCN